MKKNKKRTPEAQVDSGDQEAKRKGFVALQINGVERILTADDLRSLAAFEELREELRQQAGPIVADLRRLVDLPPEVRVDLLRFLESEAERITFMVGPQEGDTLFESVLEILKGLRRLDDFPAFRELAIEAAAVIYGHSCEVACRQIREAFCRAGIEELTRRELIREVRTLSQELDRHFKRPEGELVSQVCPDAPVSAALRFPEGYVVSDADVSGGPIGDTVLPTPVFITRRLIEPRSGRERVELMWRRDKAWASRLVDREQIADARKIVDLAAIGLPVTSNTARAVVEYLAAFEAANIDVLPKVRVVSQLGWVGAPEEGLFLFGRELIAADAEAAHVVFQGDDVGDEQTADAVRCEGSLEVWLDMLAELAPFPRAMLTVYASFAAPLIPVLGCPNFVLDINGRTSSGKTSLARVACSVNADPDERGRAPGLASWEGTPTSRERRFAVLNNLAVCLDDSARVPSPGEVAATVYQWAQGAGRGRGTIRGSACVNTFSSVLISTGERPLTSFTQDGGTRARVLSLTGSPLEGTSAEAGALAARMSEVARQNFGHPGREFVRFVICSRSRWDNWRESYQKAVKRFCRLADKAENPFARRMAPYFASIVTAARLVHKALELPFPYADPVEPLWLELTREAAGANRGLDALRYLHGWAEAHPDEFYTGDDRRQPNNGWAGSRRRSGADDRWNLGFVRTRLEELLKIQGFDCTSTVRGWQDDCLLVFTREKDGSRRNTVRVRMGGGDSMRVIAFDRAAVAAAIRD